MTKAKASKKSAPISGNKAAQVLESTPEPKKYKRSSSPGVTAYECLWDEKNNGKHTHECNNCGEVGNQHTKECQDDQDNGVRIVRPKVRA